jgi:putative PIG3 family NAD(P)H quinone oxidoreductase
MRAIVLTAPGDTSVLALREVPTPSPGPQQIRVRVRAAGLNRADLLQRRGLYPAPPGWPSDIPGLEYAGEVEALGPGVTRWQMGDRVMGLVGAGAHAENVVVHEDEAMAVPSGMSFGDAAAIPEAFLTAWDGLVTRGRLQRGERALIHAGGSGVGTAAIQLVKFLGGTSVGTSRSPEKLARCTELGLDEAIDTSGGGFLPRLAAPVNVILDVLGGPAFGDNLEALAPRGRLVLLGFLQGAKTATSLERLVHKRLEVIGSVMRTRSLEERIVLVRDFAERVLPGFAAGKLRPVVGASYPMSDIAAAHGAMERDENFGKIVLVW